MAHVLRQISESRTEMTLRDYAAPLRDLPVDKITTDDVRAASRPHRNNKPETVVRCVSGAGCAGALRAASFRSQCCFIGRRPSLLRNLGVPSRRKPCPHRCGTLRASTYSSPAFCSIATAGAAPRWANYGIVEPTNPIVWGIRHPGQCRAGYGFHGAARSGRSPADGRGDRRHARLGRRHQRSGAAQSACARRNDRGAAARVRATRVQGPPLTETDRSR